MCIREMSIRGQDYDWAILVLFHSHTPKTHFQNAQRQWPRNMIIDIELTARNLFYFYFKQLYNCTCSYFSIQWSWREVPRNTTLNMIVCKQNRHFKRTFSMLQKSSAIWSLPTRIDHNISSRAGRSSCTYLARSSEHPLKDKEELHQVIGKLSLGHGRVIQLREDKTESFFLKNEAKRGRIVSTCKKGIHHERFLRHRTEQ